MKSNQPSEDAVQLWRATRTYGRRVTALDDVTLGFRAGSFTAVMGPSGSGKSTLLQCAAGLDRLTKGQAFVGGVDVTRLREKQLTRLRRERLGFVFQAFNLLPALTAKQNVALPLRLAGERSDVRARARAALAAVGLADRSGHLPGQLSGGQQQRVAIARALVTRPEVVFADEPTGALDTNTARDILSLLRSVSQDHGQTIIMVTHDPVAASYADRALFLANGRVRDELLAPAAAEVAARMTDIELETAGVGR
ncbi:ABC transporter ATP-binding protein [Nocardioides speluncae]|uniref:ABC transporter ATP-binding protein n=1 Tax=Nocardioides speluncae TaxID=2670337 RepID=UPI000D69CAE3|nr:ABC transporter ATP-binding protein [Nocardioides speluncae]